MSAETVADLTELFDDFRMLCDVGRSMEPTNYPDFVCENPAEWSAILIHKGKRYPALICNSCRKRSANLIEVTPL